ncbi:MAG: alcohol dehydrogenase catalytic domain-containing protein [Bradyrhizobiaceae bacterium]|nr:alcohol dehydrogenase catalytic domain-containing protein [Bradyrhizobiaceae bacterium]
MTRVTRQAYADYGVPLSEISAELPAPQGSEVVVRVGHCGVCHSDVHLHDGYFDLGSGRKLNMAGSQQLPFTLGHEIEGTIEAAGPDAAGAEIGRRVVVYPWIGCGSCALCLRGDEHLCARPRQIGIQKDGGYATHVLVPHPRYLLDYEPISPGLAGTYMCSGVTAYSSIAKLGAAAGDGPVLLIGLGGVGLMGLSFLLATTKQKPLVVDIDGKKRALAVQMGAAAAFDPADPGARKAVLSASDGGVAAAVDFVGSEASVAFALGALGRGGRLVVTGLIGGELKYPIPIFPLKGVSIVGNYVGSLAEAKEMLALVRAGRVPPIPITERPLAEANAALDDLRAGRAVGRMVLVP